MASVFVQVRLPDFVADQLDRKVAEIKKRNHKMSRQAAIVAALLAYKPLGIEVPDDFQLF